MPYLKMLHIAEVTHIGHLMQPLEDRRPSADGPCVAVSTSPDDWRRIAGLNGPDIKLRFPPAQWVDALDFDDTSQSELRDWMLLRRYAKEIDVYCVNVFDEEKDDFVERTFETLELAAKSIGRSLEEEETASSEGRGGVTQDRGLKLTKRAIRRLGGAGRWSNALNWFDASVILYCREVVLFKRPFAVGIWWSQAKSPSSGVSDYGLVFPERLHLFSVEDEDEEEQPFNEAFPDFSRLQGAS